ncbi:HEPN domain-containing protein [Bradyrhizobium niftali]|uniref:Uncharacterized protein n=1 Tax=Bradyrhizobium niftali TaxID=2560055 RepID=A0A4Y9KXH9_9BRAD|nr:HEPN domain-containing protein [Bradyrhizobium niftali]TFV35855.1 hypothetical protein E4K65_46225 [Bradyrhizobium niftali]
MDTLLGANLSGVFWATDDPASQLSGKLEIDENGAATLNVEGERSILIALDARQKFQMHGMAQGERITLFDCFTVWVPFFPTEKPVKACIAVNIVSVGAHIENLKVPFASGLSFSTPELIRWTGLRGMMNKSTQKELKVTYRGKKAKEVRVSGATFQLSTGIRESRSISEIKLIERHRVRVAFDKPQSVSEADRWTTKICRLFSVALRCEIVCRVYTIERETGESVRMVGPWSASNSGESKIPHPLFTRPTRRAVYEKVLRSWFAQYDRLEPVISLRVALLSHPQKFREFEFLTYIQALEALHRRTHPARKLVTEKTYAALHRKLADAIPSHWKQKADLVRKLEYLNEISLADRLRDIFTHDKELLSKLFKDEGKDIALIRDARNYLTHYEGKRKETKIKAYLATGWFLYFTQKVLLLLEIEILRAIGFSASEIRKLVENDPTYRDLCKIDHSGG